MTGLESMTGILSYSYSLTASTLGWFPKAFYNCHLRWMILKHKYSHYRFPMAFNDMMTIRHICEKIGSTSSISWWWSAISLLQRHTETRLQRCSDEPGMPSLWDPPATNLGWQTQGPSNIAPSSSTTCMVSIRIVCWILPSDDQLYFSSKRDRESSSIQHCTSQFCSLSKLDKILESCLVKSIRKVKKSKSKEL